MPGKINFYKIGFVVLVILLIITILFVSSEKTACPECQNCPVIEEKALVSAIIADGWWINTYDSNEIFFSATIYNYGDSEAKNIVLECKMYDYDEEGYSTSSIPIFTMTEDSGNLASRSYKTIDMNYSSLGTDDYSQISCLVKSCDNCENLDTKIKY